MKLAFRMNASDSWNILRELKLALQPKQIKQGGGGVCVCGHSGNFWASSRQLPLKKRQLHLSQGWWSVDALRIRTCFLPAAVFVMERMLCTLRSCSELWRGKEGERRVNICGQWSLAQPMQLSLMYSPEHPLICHLVPFLVTPMENRCGMSRYLD